MKMIEMAHVVEATMAVPGCPVLTSNQAHAVAMKLREIIEQPSAQGQYEPVAWQFYQDGKWWDGSRTSKGHRKNTEAAGIPIRELYTHADAGEVERLREEIQSLRKALPNSTTELVDLRAKLAETPTMQEAVACVFDWLKMAACNTSGKEWSEELEELAEECIEYAPQYKRLWKDIVELSVELETTKKLYSEACQASYDFGALQAQLAEREAHLTGCKSLLRQVLPCLAMSTNSQSASYMRKIESALSASAETNATID